MADYLEVTSTWPAEVFIQRHYQSLLALGLDVHLIAHNADKKYAQRASIQATELPWPVLTMPNFNHLALPVKLAKIWQYGLTGDLFRGRRKLRERVILAFFRQQKPTLIHFHTVQLATSLRWVPQTLGIPYTVSLRGSDIQVSPLRSPQALQTAVEAISFAAGIHVVCDQLGEFIAQRGLQYTTIYTPVPLPETLPSYPSSGQDGLRFLSVGRLHWRKGYPDLLVALRGLLDSGVKAHLTLVGSGPDEERINNRIDRLHLAHNVQLIGKASFTQILELMASSHAYIQASLAEGLSNAVAEAMAWGCPVFATSVGGTSEVIKDSQTGFLLTPFYPDEWIECLKLASDNRLMASIRRRAYEVARATFAPELHGRRFIDFYQQAMSARPVESLAQATQASTTMDGSLDFPQDDKKGLRILVWGYWKWENGIDILLRELGVYFKTQPISLRIVGLGPQEDELRYLAHSLGFGTQSMVGISEQEYQDPQVKSRWWRGVHLVINAIEGAVTTWRLVTDLNTWDVPAGDVNTVRLRMEELCQ